MLSSTLPYLPGHLAVTFKMLPCEQRTSAQQGQIMDESHRKTGSAFVLFLYESSARVRLWWLLGESKRETSKHALTTSAIHFQLYAPDQAPAPAPAPTEKYVFAKNDFEHLSGLRPLRALTIEKLETVNRGLKIQNRIGRLKTGELSNS